MRICYNFELNALVELMSLNPNVDISEIHSLDDALASYAWNRNDLLYPNEKKNVHLSKNLLSNTNYPQYASVIETICRIIKEGGNLSPYLSKKKRNPLYGDALLDSVNIHHFHLNTKHKGNELLYAYCDLHKHDDVYLLDIGSHDDFECVRHWYDILFKNWPNLRSKLLNNDFLILADNSASIKKHLYGISYGIVPYEDKALLIGMNKVVIKSAVKKWKHMLQVLENYILNFPDVLCRATQIQMPLLEDQWVCVTGIGHDFVIFHLGNHELILKDFGLYIELLLPPDQGT